MDLRDSAHRLAVSAWRLEFEKSPELQKRAYEQEWASLLARLERDIGNSARFLHPNHKIVLDRSSYTIQLSEASNQVPLTKCHMTSSGVGQLRLRVVGRNDQERHEEFRLVRMDSGNYAWSSRAGVIETVGLSQFCLKLLLDFGNDILAAELQVDPPEISPTPDY